MIETDVLNDTFVSVSLLTTPAKQVTISMISDHIVDVSLIRDLLEVCGSLDFDAGLVSLSTVAFGKCYKGSASVLDSLPR